ncbi:MAG: 5'-methylthioadenosine/adenosylhomocysteine nucleosidase [Clostridia bacterium]|nr:5'-methylthioadenosine/adenosylhomocysteine nucleosidase [Clostridia bacterium]
MQEIGIIVAMEEEREAIVKIMTEVKVEQIYNLRFLRGKIQGKNCVLVKSGIGKVNAARTTQVMLQNFKIQYVINLGSGGAINSLLNIGDVLIGKQVVQHDFDITAFGHSKGYITGVGNAIICDRNLVDELEQIIKSIPERSYQIKLGVIATGDIFCTESWMKDKIRGKFGADVVDMECAAIGQVCYLDNVPFMAIRSISDTPNGKNASTFDENLKLASKRCANILKEFLSLHAPLYNF